MSTPADTDWNEIAVLLTGAYHQVAPASPARDIRYR